MNYHLKMLQLAVIAANLEKGDRNFYVGAVTNRKDGTYICSPNGSAEKPNAYHHAESRLVRKLDMADTVYVARIKKNGERAIARPCIGCALFLRSKLVKRVIYTISDEEYGVLYL